MICPTAEGFPFSTNHVSDNKTSDNRNVLDKLPTLVTESYCIMEHLKTALLGAGLVASLVGDSGVPFAGLVGTALKVGGKLVGMALDVGGGDSEDTEDTEDTEGAGSGKGKGSGRGNDSDIQRTLQSGFLNMSTQFRSVKKDLESIQNLAAGSFEILKEMNYLDGIENIDSAYSVFFSSHNLDARMAQFTSHRFELEKQYTQHMNPRKIIRFLDILKKEGADGPKKAQAMFNYVVTVEAKYLQMMTFCHMSSKDYDGLAEQYEIFTSHCEQLAAAMVLDGKIGVGAQLCFAKDWW